GGCEDGAGRLRYADLLWRGDIAFVRFDGAARVDAKRSTQQMILAQPLQQNVRVGDSGMYSADAVAGRPWFRARALGADSQHAAAVEPGDAAASGADGMHIDCRRLDRQAVDRST